MNQAQQADRLQALDAWRGICALAVALFHLPVAHRLTGAQSLANLQLCVDFFFVLSGFVISRAYADSLTNVVGGWRFLITRFGRLWPLHIVLLGLFVGLEITRHLASTDSRLASLMQQPPFSAGHSFEEIATSALFLQAFGLHPTASWNFPAWSVAAEFYTYVVFAAICIATTRWRTIVFAVLALTSAIVLYTVSPHDLFVSFDWGFLRCLMGFFVGCLVYRIRGMARYTPPHITALELLTSAVAISFVVLSPPGSPQYAAPLVFAALIYVFSFDAGGLSAGLKARPFQMLGLWSYSIYMVHILVFQVTRTALVFASNKLGVGTFEMRHGEKMLTVGDSNLALLASFVSGLLLVVPVAALSYRWIERPSTEWFRRLAGRQEDRRFDTVATVLDPSPTLVPKQLV